jgi:transcriptional regulator with XRE-family HTH domain
MAKVRSLFKKAGLTMSDLGIKMGYPAEVARQSVFQFMKSADPHVSMLRRFATAMGILLEDLLIEKSKKKNERQ